MAQEKKVKTEELILEARNFLNSYKKQIGLAVKTGKNVLLLNFEDLSSSSPTLSELLISNPEEIIQVLEVALEESGLISNPRIRFLELPAGYDDKIRNLRAKHLNKFIQIEGIVRQASEVRPQVVNAKFECPSCGSLVSVLQIESKFREPSRCSCGRKGGFKLISKDMVDAQRLVIEESPESLSGGEQPRRISVFLKEDLVEPKMEEKTTPGSRIKVIGILKEVIKHNQTGSPLTRYDIAIEANNMIPLEESFEEFNISEEDERQIQELAADPEVFKRFSDSIAPSIYGYDEIKQCLVLQLFGGVKKTRSDGTQARGDLHILLVGDPGVAKSIGKNEKILHFTNQEYGYESVENLFKKFGRYPKNLKTLTINMKTHKPEWELVKEIIKHLPEKELIKITTEHGKKITATKDHSFITLSHEGEIISIKGDNLKKDSYLPIPINFHKEVIKSIETAQFNTFLTNSRQLPKKIKLNEEFGFFIGIFLSEGCIKAGKVVNISNKNKQIQGKTISFAKKLNLSIKNNEKEISIYSKSLSNLLKFYCYDPKAKITSKIKGNYSRIKKIPDFSYFSPKDFVSGLISGIFSGDGRFIKDRKRIKGVELITVSKKLAQGTSDILFSIGILNKIKARKYSYNNKKTNYYIVSIPSQMIEKFRKNFNFYGRRYLDCPKPIYSYHNCIPCGNLIYDLVKKLGYNSRINGNRTFAAEMRTVKKRNKIGRLRLRKVLKLLQKRMRGNYEEFETLKKIAYSPIVWSKIEKIEVLKMEKGEVYDLSIPRTNTFVANGIGVHNSVTLKFISQIAPKGRYVAGRGTTGAGLTATVVRDEFLRGWALEAGAMVLSNKGIICIDEIEKMDAQDRSAMHEAMEQQCVSISKANIQATLRSETSVLAAGNPKFGRFDPYQTVASQIDIPPALINRFDVIFIMKDLPDRAKDELIATHVLLEHKEKQQRNIIDRELFRKYIAYSKQRIKPQLTDEAIEEIKRFYVELRNTSVASDQPTRPLPISARQLEALIRMSEAMAKLRLSLKVSRDDAKKTIEIMKFYLMQVGYDYETKTFDIDRIATGVSTSQRSKIILVREALSRLESRIGKFIPIEEVEKELEGKADIKDVEDALDKLTISGDIFHPRKGFVQRM